MSHDKLQQFKTELRELLIKYDADIDASTDSDSQGSYGEHLILSIANPESSRKWHNRFEERVDDWSVLDALNR